MSPAAKKRTIYFLISIITFIIIARFVYVSLNANTVYFFSPTDLKNISEKPNGIIRVGGLVKKKFFCRKQTKTTL